MRRARRPINLGVILAVVLATLTAGLFGGLLVWVVWHYDLLQPSDRRGQP